MATCRCSDSHRAGGEGCARCQPKQDSPGLTNANRGSGRQGGRDHGERPRHLSIRRQISPKKNQGPRQHGNRKSRKIGPRPTGSIVGINCKAVQDHKTRLGGVGPRIVAKFSRANRHHQGNQHPQNPNVTQHEIGQRYPDWNRVANNGHKRKVKRRAALPVIPLVRLDICKRTSEVALKRPCVEGPDSQAYAGRDGTIAKPLAIQQVNSQPDKSENSKGSNHSGQRSQDCRVYPPFPPQRDEGAQKQCHKKRLCSSQQ